MESKFGTETPPYGDRRDWQARLAFVEAECTRLTAEVEQRTRELEQSRAHFRDVIERNADAIVVVDGEGVIRFANAVASDLFRSAREDLIGTPFGFPITVGEATELDLVANGDTHVAEMRVVESEWEGELAYIASLRDITERKRAEESARGLIREQAARTSAEAAAKRFRFLAEASTRLSLPLDYKETLTTLASLCIDQVADWVIIYVVDERGVVQRLEVAHCDPARHEVVQALRALPITPDSAHPVLEVLRTRKPLLVTNVDDARLAEMTESEEHLELARKLGVSSFMMVPLVARNREIGAIALGMSSPERQFTEEDLAAANDLAMRAALAVDNARLYRVAQEANQAKSNLLAVISHDLRTPLNSIMGHAELLTLGIPDPLTDATLQRVDRIRMSTMHLVYLIDELLSFARLDSGHEELRLLELDARVVVREVAAVVEQLAQARGLALEVTLPDEPVMMTTDPDRLRQVLMNLVGNAIKYTEDGRVELVLHASAEQPVRFAVSDTGIGIDAAHIEQIFEPFWQVDPLQRARNGGTGLGLSVVRRLVRLLGGEISVTSEVGHGSTFTVQLPRKVGY